MIVTSISSSADRAGRYRVEFSDGSIMKLLPSVIGDAGLFTGRELDEVQMNELHRISSKADTKLRAIRIISATTVSCNELEQRLCNKGSRPEDAKETVQWLSDLNILNDTETARQIVLKGVHKGYGKMRIQQMLYEKKIPHFLWEEALAEMPSMDEAVDSFLQSKLHGQTEKKQIKRTVDALIRRGFTWDEIKEGLNRYNDALAETLEDE